MPTTIRCKMRLNAVVGQQWGGVKAIFNCEYDPETEEDRRFCKATPNGTAEFQIDNPRAFEHLVIGAYYYFDMSPVEADPHQPHPSGSRS